MAKASEYVVYVGTSVRGESQGIIMYRMDRSSGRLQPSGVVPHKKNPGFLAIHPNQRYLYAVHAGEEGPNGAVSAYAIEPKTGNLTLLGQQPSGGRGPCHISVDPDGRFVLVAHYGGGSVAILPIREDGALDAPSDTVQHQGSSINPERQGEPHPHFMSQGPSGEYAYVPDLGIDQVVIYQVNRQQKKLLPNGSAPLKPGAGPRHLAFDPTGNYAYVINELDSTVTAYRSDGSSGRLTAFQTIPTIPDDFTETNYPADIHVHPSGRFLYGSNRGHDSIVIYGVNQETGRLSCLGYEPTQGAWPRNFALDPAGEFLLAANQNGDTLVVFRIDQGTGLLQPTGQVLALPNPVCVKLLPV